ncbi:unnamed protein product [Adineta ricciae]|uniref:Uncharacterized protein n=1 Tax=Adineta ricciae TaxID=249248 RepID=A0A814L8J6_ADIRI|nr:unnamed protein product [Adineta ricciae]
MLHIYPVLLSIVLVQSNVILSCSRKYKYKIIQLLQSFVNIIIFHSIIGKHSTHLNGKFRQSPAYFTRFYL